MELTLPGGADEVSAGCILTEIAGRRVRIDADIRPTLKARSELAGNHLPTSAGSSGAAGRTPSSSRTRTPTTPVRSN